MRKITVRPTLPTDDFQRIALCLYSTDPFIYPAAFGPNAYNASQAIASLMKLEGGLFHYSNILIALIENQVCGILLYNKSGAYWEQMCCNQAVKDYIPSLDNFIYVSKEYFSVEAVSPPCQHLEVVACCVLPEFRKLGVAQALLVWLIDKHPEKTLTLDVLADNSAAVCLYKKCGFRIVGTDKGFSMDISSRPNTYHMVREPDTFTS